MFEYNGRAMLVQDQSALPDLQALVGALRDAVHRLDPDYLSAEEATSLVRLFAEVERLGAAGRALMARQVERSGAWRSGGHRSAAHWMAEATGVPVGQAVGTLQTARALEHLPATEEAYRSGELSEARIREVATAAVANPRAEGELLEAARTDTVSSLKERCRRAVAEAVIDETGSYERIRRGRYLRHWTDPDGAFRLQAKLTADDGARVLAGLEPHQSRIFHEARRAGRKEPSEAYAADALVAMATPRGGDEHPGARAMVHVRVDAEALRRGHVEGGEVSEIPGVGPIPVAAARRLLNDAIVKVIFTEGTDIKAVAHVGRTIPAKLRTALEERDPTCVVPVCDVRMGLEIDHIIPYAEGGLTTLANTARLCKWHHYLKTHHGYQLGGCSGSWTWEGPDPPPG
jgi:hypothetical protein